MARRSGHCIGTRKKSDVTHYSDYSTVHMVFPNSMQRMSASHPLPCTNKLLKFSAGDAYGAWKRTFPVLGKHWKGSDVIN